jgi:pimeloyl-ACP methyl ester carboxylesterase
VKNVETARGVFGNAMEYARFGSGSRTVLAVPGGPGNTLPPGLMERMTARMFRPFLDDDYTVWIVTRKRGMPQGHTIEAMADDFAELIGEEFEGLIDVYVGISLGGAVGVYLAANHPACFRHIILAGIGYEVSERGKRLDYGFAKQLGDRNRSGAGVLIAGDIVARSRLRRFPWIAPLIGPVIGRMMFGGHTHPAFESDVLIEAEAEVAFDARDVLPDIEVPVLLIAGDRDDYFPKAVLEDTARLIRQATLLLYEGKSHEGAIMDRRLARDALRYVND